MLYEAEKDYLIDLPHSEFSNIQTSCSTADKYSTVIIDKNRYSVPTSYAYFKVDVVLYVDCVEIFHGSKNIASHTRLYDVNTWSLKPEHYLELIRQRPQAFDSAHTIRQWRKSWPYCLERLLDQFCQKQGQAKGIKDFISVLMLYKDHAAAYIESAVEKALTANASSSEAVVHMVKSSQQDLSFLPLRNWQTLPPPNISIYGQIGGKL